MYKDSRKRTISKTVTWRITATLTTMTLVLAFTGEIATAIEVGILEWIAKMIFYYVHERAWDRLKWGKKEIPAFVVWITGIPLSGKTTVGNMLFEELKGQKLRIQRLDSHDVRPLFPETGFSKEEVDNHIKRVGHLASMLENNGIITIASFVSPYRDSRKFVRNICNNFIEVHLDTTVEHVRKYDKEGFYKKVEAGKMDHVPEVDFPFEASDNNAVTVDMTRHSLEEARHQVMEVIKKRYLSQ